MFSITNREDKRVWRHNNNGTYRVNITYKELSANYAISSGTNRSRIENTVWKNLWKLKIPYKFIIFHWKILNDSLPVRDKLRKRNIHVDRSCPMCNKEGESINHLFLECELTRVVWLGSDLSIRTDFLGQETVKSLLC